MNKAYVILKRGFEYDDSIYSPIEGGNPNLIVFSREEATEKAKQLNIEEFKKVSISDYAYEIEDILTVDKEEYDKLNESLVQKYGEIKKSNSWNTTENTLHPLASEEESKKYLEMIDFTFFEIIETDIDVSSYRNKKIEEIL